MDLLTLFRYTLRHIGFWLSVTWGVTVGVLLCGDVFEMVRRSAGHPHFLHVLSLASLKIPSHTDYFLPFISFVAARLALWRLQKRRELLALGSIGVSGFFWLRVFGAVTLALGALHLCVLQPISAALQNTWSDYEEQWLHQRSNYRFAVVTSGLWLREEHTTGYRIIHAKNISDNTLHALRIYEWVDNTQRFQSYTEASEALLKDNAWQLHRVKIVSSLGEEQTLEHHHLPTQLTWNNVVSSQVDPRSLSIWRVGEWLPLLQQVGLSTRPYLMHWHRHIAQIGLISALLLWVTVLMSLPLVWMLSGLVIYCAHDVVQALGQAGHIPMVLSVWCVPLVLMLISLGWLIHHEEKVQ